MKIMILLAWVTNSMVIFSASYRTGIITEIILFLSLFLQFIFIYRNKHRNKIISVNSVSPYRTEINTEMISFLSLFLQFTEVNTEIKSFL